MNDIHVVITQDKNAPCNSYTGLDYYFFDNEILALDWLNEYKKNNPVGHYCEYQKWSIIKFATWVAKSIKELHLHNNMRW